MLLERKRCSSCREVKEIDAFKPQARNPRLRYAWCEVCRTVNKMFGHVSAKDEYKLLREKGKSMRNLTPERIKEVQKLTAEGLKTQDVAGRLGVPEIVIKRTLKKLEKQPA